MSGFWNIKGGSSKLLNSYIVDVGSFQTKVAYNGRMVTLEPSLVAEESLSGEIVAVGHRANQYIIGSSPAQFSQHFIVNGRQISNQRWFLIFLNKLLDNLRWLDDTYLAKKYPGFYLLPIEISSQENQQVSKLIQQLKYPLNLIDGRVAIERFSKQWRVDKSILVVDIGAHHCVGYCISDNRIQQYWQVPWGINRVRQIVKRNLTHKSIVCDEQEVTRIIEQLITIQPSHSSTFKKMVISVKTSTRLTLENKLISGQMFYEQIEELIHEITWLLQHWLMRSRRILSERKMPQIEEFCLIGGGANLVGLTGYLQYQLQINSIQIDEPELALCKYLSKNYGASRNVSNKYGKQSI